MSESKRESASRPEVVRYKGFTYFVRWRKRTGDWKVTYGINKGTGDIPQDDDVIFVREAARLYYANKGFGGMTFKEFFRRMTS